MNIGLDVLIAWLMFAAFVGTLGVCVVRHSNDDALAEARRGREAADPREVP